MTHLWHSTPAVAVDLGTANTIVRVRGRGVALHEPSVIALDRATGEVRALGAEARRMLGRAPGTIEAVRPLRHGVIADYDATQAMLRLLFRRTVSRLARPRVVVAAPWQITSVERRAIEDATLGAGASQAFVIEEPLAAAIGSGLEIAEPRASMVVDIGAGTTEAVVISLGGIVAGQSIRVGGDELDEAIADHLRAEHRLLIGDHTAEHVKLTVGSVRPSTLGGDVDVRGRDVRTGLPRAVTVGADEIRDALEEPIVTIVEAVRATLDRTPPELVVDLLDRGLVLTGGCALLPGLAARLRRDAYVPVHVSEQPLDSVADGAAATLEELGTLTRLARAR